MRQGQGLDCHVSGIGHDTDSVLREVRWAADRTLKDILPEQIASALKALCARKKFLGGTSDLRRFCIHGRGGCSLHPHIHVLAMEHFASKVAKLTTAYSSM